MTPNAYQTTAPQQDPNRLGGLVKSLTARTTAPLEARMTILKVADGVFHLLYVENGTIMHACPDRGAPGEWTSQTTGIAAIALTSVPDRAEPDGLFALSPADGSGAHRFLQLTYDAKWNSITAKKLQPRITSAPSLKSVENFTARRHPTRADAYVLSVGVHRAMDADDRNHEQIYVTTEVGRDLPLAGAADWLVWSPEAVKFPNQILKSYQAERVDLALKDVPRSIGSFLGLVQGRPTLLATSNEAVRGPYAVKEVKRTTGTSQLPDPGEVIGKDMMAWLSSPDAPPEVFIISAGTGIKSAQSRLDDAGNMIWPDTWTPAPGSKTTPEQNFVRIQATRLAANGGLDLFLTDHEYRLWNRHRDADGNWRDLELVAHDVHGFVTGFADSGPSAAPSVFVDSGIPQHFARMTRVDGRWVADEIDFSNTPAQGIAPRHQCSVTLPIMADSKLAVPGQAVRITAPYTIDAVVNGRRARLTPTSSYATLTDGNGQVSIRTATVGALGAPQITVEGTTVPKDRQDLSASAGLHAFFGKLDSSGISDARDPATGDPVFPPQDALDDTDHDSIAAAVKLAASAGASLLPGQNRPTAVTGEPGAIVFGPRSVTRKPLTVAAFDTAWERAHADRPEAEAFLIDKGILGFGWGDLVQAVREKLLDLGEALVDGARVILSIGGKLFAFVLDELAQAFDMIWDIFETVGAAFESVFNWLQDAFDTFLSWTSIVSVKNRIKAFLISETLLHASAIPLPSTQKDLITTQFTTARTAVSQWLDDRKHNRTNTALNALLSKAGVDDKTPVTANRPRDASWAGMTVGKDDQPLMPQYGLQWLLDELSELQSAVIGSLTPPGFDKISSELNTLLNGVLKDGLTTAKDIGQTTYDGIKGWFKDPAAFGDKRLVATLGALVAPVAMDALDLAENAALHGLDVGDAVVGAIPGYVDWLDHPITLPFFSGFYTYVLNGGDPGGDNHLSLLDLQMLIVAALATPFVSNTPTHAEASDKPSLDENAIAGTSVACAALGTVLGAITDLAELTLASFKATKTTSRFTDAGVLFLRIIGNGFNACAAIFSVAGAFLVGASKTIKGMASVFAIIPFAATLVAIFAVTQASPSGPVFFLGAMVAFAEFILLVTLGGRMLSEAEKNTGQSPAVKAAEITAGVAAFVYAVGAFIGLGGVFLANIYAPQTPLSGPVLAGYVAYSFVHNVPGAIGALMLAGAIVVLNAQDHSAPPGRAFA